MLKWWSQRDHAQQSCHSDTTNRGHWCCFTETTGFLAVWPWALVRTSWSVVRSSKYHPGEDEVWSCGSRSTSPICLRSTRHYSAIARSSLYSIENRITKLCLPFKTTTLTAAFTHGRPWWLKAIQLLRRMLKLRGGTVTDAANDEIFRELFLQKLSLTVRTALAVY